jgi:hypothetical protein
LSVWWSRLFPLGATAMCRGGQFRWGAASCFRWSVPPPLATGTGDVPAVPPRLRPCRRGRLSLRDGAARTACRASTEITGSIRLILLRAGCGWNTSGQGLDARRTGAVQIAARRASSTGLWRRHHTSRGSLCQETIVYSSSSSPLLPCAGEGEQKTTTNGGGCSPRSSCGSASRRIWHQALRAGCRASKGRIPPPLWMSAGSIHLSQETIPMPNPAVKSVCSGQNRAPPSVAHRGVWTGSRTAP